ncbi:MAG: DUF4345 domain-containing protein [Bacteroidetes bacterium]|nr:DUF4345 domain-containing protein [Bacteroidota bacterium]
MTNRITQIFLGLMGIAFAKVGLEALIDPQRVLAQVGITLDNVSALSSMRAVYGGMHLAFGLYCVWGIFRNPRGPLALVILYTIGFVTGRLSGIILDGTPNTFVVTWLVTESVSLASASFLYYYSGVRENSINTIVASSVHRK